MGSIGAPLLWGIALASLLYGVPIASDQTFAGDFGDLFSAYTVLAGIAVCLLFAFHGAVFLTLRTLGDLRERARRAAARLAPLTALVGAGFLIWTLVVANDRNDKGVFPGILPVAVAAVAAVAAIFLVRRASEKWAFAATALTIVAVVVTPFREPLSASDGVGPGLRQQPHDRQRLLRRLHPLFTRHVGRDDRPTIVIWPSTGAKVPRF